MSDLCFEGAEGLVGVLLVTLVHLKLTVDLDQTGVLQTRLLRLVKDKDELQNHSKQPRRNIVGDDVQVIVTWRWPKTV